MMQQKSIETIELILRKVANWNSCSYADKSEELAAARRAYLEFCAEHSMRPEFTHLWDGMC